MRVNRVIGLVVRLQIVKQIAQLGRFSKSSFSAAALISSLNLFDDLAGLAVEKFAGFFDAAVIIRLG